LEEIVRTETRNFSLLSAMLAVVVTLFAALAFTACGGGDDDDNGDDEPTAVVTQAQEEETPDVQGEADTVSIDQDFWHAGWKVTLGDATFTPGDFGGGEVSIDALFENLGEDTATFDSRLVLTAGGESYESTDSEFPQVPGNLGNDGTLLFDVEDDFTFDDATLVIGNPANNQATVPIGSDSEDEYVSLEPRDVVVTGTIVAGAVTVNVEGAEVRADFPDRHSIAEAGKKAMIIRFSVTPASGIQVGQGVFQSPNVALKLPDGTAVAVISDGVSGVNELLQGKEGTTISDLSVRFEVDDPVEGEYAFVVRGAYGPGGAQVEGELAFTVPPAGGASATPASGTEPAATATP
jgi:hypothetical protein